mmetsp:Transcript_4472/g.6923  ORF Transcript_4472/g.6923 Transcript_4472/m.6923 type:complete len:112 (-) Transcript_4472:316-651(-)
MFNVVLRNIINIKKQMAREQMAKVLPWLLKLGPRPYVTAGQKIRFRGQEATIEEDGQVSWNSGAATRIDSVDKFCNSLGGARDACWGCAHVIFASGREHTIRQLREMQKKD